MRKINFPHFSNNPPPRVPILLLQSRNRIHSESHTLDNPCAYYIWQHLLYLHPMGNHEYVYTLNTVNDPTLRQQGEHVHPTDNREYAHTPMYRDVHRPPHRCMCLHPTDILVRVERSL